MDIKINAGKQTLHIKPILGKKTYFLYTNESALIFTKINVKTTISFIYYDLNYIGYLNNKKINNKILQVLKDMSNEV